MYPQGCGGSSPFFGTKLFRAALPFLVNNGKHRNYGTVIGAIRFGAGEETAIHFLISGIV
jgi:hypothetical protein